MKKHLFFLIVLTIFSLTLSGCVMTTKYHITKSPVTQEDEKGGIIIKCTYLNREDLIKRHGLKINPFLAPEGMLTPQPVIIFELEITNLEEGDIKLDQRKISFYYNDKLYSPMSRSNMEMKIVDETEKGSEKIRKERVVKQFMFNDIEVIEGNQTVKKYIMYMKNLKDRGSSELIIPIYTIANIDAAEFSFSYDFMIKK